MTAPIVGAIAPAQLYDALAAVESGLDAYLKAALDDLTTQYRVFDAAG